jgi:MFS family permease
MQVPARVLPLLVLAQVAGTSLWFAGNAVLPDLERAWGLRELFGETVGSLTISVQLGFIVGTLVLALRGIADRYSPRAVFTVCAVLAAAANLVPVLAEVLFTDGHGRFALLLLSRFMVGVLLAGIYPVGMRIAASWYAQGLGTAMGWLIGALIVGTAAPHGLRALGAQWPWQHVVLASSALGLAGAFMVGLGVPNGPQWTRATVLPSWKGNPLRTIFATPRLRAAVLGYWGHMWELYTMLAVAPLVLAAVLNTTITPGISALTFFAIASGGVMAVAGGYASRRVGSARVAVAFLATSGLCCALMPWMLDAPLLVFGLWMLVWGATISPDSPQFSTLTAQAAPPQEVGSVLLTSNCLGFTICVISILLTTSLLSVMPLKYVGWVLLPGPLLGLWAMRAARR